MLRVSPNPKRKFLSLQEATFRLGDNLIFAGTSWTFRSDEHWALIGPNGSGKSLLADALRGRLPLVHGELAYHFRPPPGLAREQAISHVAFETKKAACHDTAAQVRWSSLEEEGVRVRDFLSYDRVLEVNPFEVTDRHAVARRAFETRRRKAIELMGLEPFLDRTVLSLSNGENQRLELARALCRPMRLLILDEPFAGLDATGRKRFAAALERLGHGPVRVLLITARPEDLPGFITHVGRVNRCRLEASGPRAQILPRFRASAQSRAIRRLQVSTLRKVPAPPHPRSGARILIELRNATVRYGEAVILKGVSWRVSEGESWALLGPNGSGKSTLLSLIQGDHPQAYANDVVVFGRARGDGESIWHAKRRFGSVSPELHLHFPDNQTCLNAVASGFLDMLAVYEKLPASRWATARSWLDRLGLGAFADSPFSALSAGLQRMVLLARALVKSPPLLILDEPCQGLDLHHCRLFISAVDRLIRHRTATVIYVTHRPDEIPTSITRVLRLNHGVAKAGHWRPPASAKHRH